MKPDEKGIPTGIVGGVDLGTIKWHEISVYALLDYSPPIGQVGLESEIEAKGPIGYRLSNAKEK